MGPGQELKSRAEMQRDLNGKKVILLPYPGGVGSPCDTARHPSLRLGE